MLKATAGGGGIGMRACAGAGELREAFGAVGRAAAASFGAGGVFLERLVAAARHVEVQVFGDGAGRVLALGDRDCTLQRRNQKVIEEAPAPGLPGPVREWIAAAAVALCASAEYRSAGTVEFVYDAEREEPSFLEVNARLQVEHPVTEAVLGIDLVAWMLRLAGGDAAMFDAPAPVPSGHAVEARVYAEDPAADHRPSPGLLTEVALPDDVRVDGWVETGTEVSAAYDPLLMKLVASGPTRVEALDRLATALEQTRIGGIRTNLGLLRAALARDDLPRGRPHHRDPRRDRRSGAADRGAAGGDDDDRPGLAGAARAVARRRLAVRAVRRPLLPARQPRPRQPGGRCRPGVHAGGAALRFSQAATVCVCGAEADVTVDGVRVPRHAPVPVPAGAVLDVGTATGRGLRTDVLVAGGLDVPAYLGSAATFTLGGFGGHGGRALRAGDVLVPGAAAAAGPVGPVPLHERPALTHGWRIAVTEGPHAAPEFFTPADIDAFYAATWEVHFNSARTGVRLVGPRPGWAREDGGEAGLHPSNIHDTPYAVGTVDFTGDVPILLGPDGPSLGGFVCPATVVATERWKLGQLPGDTVRFVAITDRPRPRALRADERDHGVLGRREADGDDPAVTYRRSGDDNLLVEYGPMVLDLGLRMRVRALAERIAAERLDGIVDLTPGIRSLQVHVDPGVLPVRRVLDLVRAAEDDLPATRDLEVPSRVVHLPLSWDDPATREATARYMANVRGDAPWCPWNIEFIRRVNGLDDVEDVRRTVYSAEYLVLGLGDVYLGAPVATPLDPRQRLVTTKYNPARTWTPENAVGIGGAYLCIYGMEGPGGYQFVGRTVQVWSRFRSGGPFEPGSPWLLRFFDRIRWHPVGAEELLDLRADLAAGRLDLDIEPGSFTLAAHRAFLEREADDIAAFRARQAAAFAAEREAWAAAGEFAPREEPAAATNGMAAAAPDVPAGGARVDAPLSASVWRVDVEPGTYVAAGQRLLTLEAMKLETAIEAPIAGEVVAVLVGAGDQVESGAALVVLGGREAA
jgi:urea carboxylase